MPRWTRASRRRECGLLDPPSRESHIHDIVHDVRRREEQASNRPLFDTVHRNNNDTIVLKHEGAENRRPRTAPPRVRLPLGHAEGRRRRLRSARRLIARAMYDNLNRFIVPCQPRAARSLGVAGRQALERRRAPAGRPTREARGHPRPDGIWRSSRQAVNEYQRTKRNRRPKAE